MKMKEMKLEGEEDGDGDEDEDGARQWVPSFKANSITKMVDKSTHKGAVEAVDYLIISTGGLAAARLERRPCGFIVITGMCRSATDPEINCLNCAAHALMSPPGCDVVAVPEGTVAKVKAACVPRLALHISQA